MLIYKIQLTTKRHRYFYNTGLEGYPVPMLRDLQYLNCYSDYININAEDIHAYFMGYTDIFLQKKTIVRLLKIKNFGNCEVELLPH